MKRMAALVACALLAGCWQSKGSLYGDRASLQPFREGRVESRAAGRNANIGRARLTWRRDGYRLTNDDRRDSDFGDYFTLRFFALSGAPAGTLVFEATDPCKADDKKCTPQTAPRYYGLARATRRGAAMFNPECAKNDPLGKRPGVTVEDYGICDFTERAELEKALSALAATDWKASVTYRFMDSAK